MNLDNDKIALTSKFELIKNGLTDKYVFFTGIQQRDLRRLHHCFGYDQSIRPGISYGRELYMFFNGLKRYTDASEMIC